MFTTHGLPERAAARCLVAGVIAGFLVLMSGGSVQASQTLYVANVGVDNADCGPAGKLPCRSISRAIAHALSDDQIIVGPGVYGDINGDFQMDPIGNPGEEAWVWLDPDNVVIITIDKRLTILSRDGAAATVIDSGNPNYDILVRIAADGVVFGKPGKGFTLRQGGIGVMVDGVADVRIAGNMAESFYNFAFLAGSFEIGGVPASGTTLKGNKAFLSNWGFGVNDKTAAVRGNLAIRNAYGFLVGGSSSTTVSKNLAAGNLDVGFMLVAMPATDNEFPSFSGNAAIGNADAGLRMNVYEVTVPVSASVSKNTLAGNFVRGGTCDGGDNDGHICTTDADCPPVNPYDPNTCRPDFNCGLAVTNATYQSVTVTADGNYWGDPGGPGADPADAAGGSCDWGTVTLNIDTWAAKEIKVAPRVK